MPKTAVWVLLAAVLVVTTAPQASADTVTVSRSQLVLFLADGLSAVPNAVTVLTGDSDGVMGWVGMGVGALSMAVGFTSEDGDWLAATGGIAMMLGICSVLVTSDIEDEELGIHQLKLVPGVSRHDGALEPRLTLKLNF